MTAGLTTAPLCRNCHKPRSPRTGQPGYTGASGYCQGCYSRWLKAGRPPEGPPPPMTASESAALANAVQRKVKGPSSVNVSLAGKSWPRLAACRGMDAEVFFPVGTASDETARATCAGCPVRRECLDYAIAQPEKYGFWGGLGEEEREKERRRRMRRGEVAA